MDAKAPPASSNDDDTTLEDVDDSGAGGAVPRPGPAVSPSLYSQMSFVIQMYGWYILIAIIVLIFIYHKYLKKYIAILWSKYEEREYYKKFDTDTMQKRQEAMEATRIKMQERFNAVADNWAEKERERQEQKRQEQIDEWEKHQRGQGYHSKTKKQDDTDPADLTDRLKKNKRGLLRRSDYSPLMGESSQPTFRPSRFDGGGAAGGG